MKLLLLDENGCLLLIRAEDPQTHAKCWYPVGGGIELGETLQEAAAREAFEETGLVSLPPGRLVWQRDHTYEFSGGGGSVAGRRSGRGIVAARRRRSR